MSSIGCWLCGRELSLRRGDIVYLLRSVDDNWFEGEHHGLVGRFPVSYVDVRDLLCDFNTFRTSLPGPGTNTAPVVKLETALCFH